MPWDRVVMPRRLVTSSSKPLTSVPLTGGGMFPLLYRNVCSKRSSFFSSFLRDAVSACAACSSSATAFSWSSVLGFYPGEQSLFFFFDQLDVLLFLPVSIDKILEQRFFDFKGFNRLVQLINCLSIGDDYILIVLYEILERFVKVKKIRKRSGGERDIYEACVAHFVIRLDAFLQVQLNILFSPLNPVYFALFLGYEITLYGDPFFKGRKLFLMVEEPGVLIPEALQEVRAP